MAIVLQTLFIVAIIGAITGFVYFTIHILSVVPIFTLGDPIDDSGLSDEELEAAPLPEHYMDQVEQRMAQAVWPRLWPSLLGALSLLLFLFCAYFQIKLE